MRTLRLWKFNQHTGLWNYQRTVTPETSDEWLKIFRRDEPRETFKVSANKPSKAPPYLRNPTPAESDDYLRIGVGVVLVGSIGWLLWDKWQSDQLASQQASQTPEQLVQQYVTQTPNPAQAYPPPAASP